MKRLICIVLTLHVFASCQNDSNDFVNYSLIGNWEGFLVVKETKDSISTTIDTIDNHQWYFGNDSLVTNQGDPELVGRDLVRDTFTYFLNQSNSSLKLEKNLYPPIGNLGLKYEITYKVIELNSTKLSLESHNKYINTKNETIFSTKTYYLTKN
ncbi:MAG: hypothetical protein R2774_11480 [Saprospiraceae bacterium]